MARKSTVEPSPLHAVGSDANGSAVAVVSPQGTHLEEANNDTALLLAGMTATLRYLMENGQVQHNLPATLGSELSLSSLPPDRVKTGEDERPQINLYLYQASAKGLASVSRYLSRENTELSLSTNEFGTMESEFEMLYLVTVFGSQDFHWEILQGYALALLRENPLLTGDRLRSIWNRITQAEGGRDVSPALAPLRDTSLRHRLHEARLSLLALPLDQVGQIWSLMQSRYRPTLFLRVALTLRSVPAPES